MDDNTELATIASPAPIKEAGSGEHHDAPDATPAPLEPQVLNGVKIYPTSYIPVKAVLHYPKKALVQMEIEHIEGIHIAFFIGVTIFLFIGMWKRPDLR
ncbi:MAG: hypothetical protein Q7U04_09765 [Bacteriovorax sp.]|nr:hypothetical protein [Bacteriovorax sp.]